MLESVASVVSKKLYWRLSVHDSTPRTRAPRSRRLAGWLAGLRAIRWRPVDLQRSFAMRRALRRWGAMELAELGVWAPVAMGVGVGLYFSLKAEPGWWIALAPLGLAALFWLAAPRLRPVALALFFACLGFAAADWRTARVSAPILERDLGFRSVAGRIVSVERGLKGERYVIALSAVSGLETEATPARARISWRGDATNLAAGDWVRLRAGLGPPPAPAAPGGFDFARQLYFQRIGAVGFAISSPDVQGRARGWAMAIENVRANLRNRIIEAAPGQGGAIVAAVVTGKRDAISEESRAALRDAGLAHLLAISGLHMGLATGIIFFAVRGALAAIGPIALRYPIKKWAAAAALLSALTPVDGSDWRACRARLIDQRSIWRRGAHAVWLDEQEITVRTVSEWRGDRPWTQ